MFKFTRLFATQLETFKGFKLQKDANSRWFFFLFPESDFPQDPSVLAPSSWNTSGHGKYAHARTHARSITFFQHKLLTHLLQEINNGMLAAPFTDGGFRFNSTRVV